MTQSEKDIREQKIITLVLFGLMLVGTAILAYGEIAGNGALSIMGLGIMLPMTLMFLFNLGVYLMSVRRPPSQTPPTDPA